MGDADSFIREWCVDGDTLVQFPAGAVNTCEFPAEHKQFLIKAGLPVEAAPFLAFGAAKKAFLLSVTEIWQLPVHVFGGYRAIGATGNGDTVCMIEGIEGRVVVLDHDAKFREIFVNSSVMHLAESLLVFRAFVKQARQSFGSEAFLQDRIPLTLRQETYKRMLQVDEGIDDEPSFWHCQLMT